MATPAAPAPSASLYVGARHDLFPPGTCGASGSSAPGLTLPAAGDLESAVSESQLYELFFTVGPVVSVRICRDVITRRSLGYAYVNFQQPADAGRAMELLNHSVLNNTPIRIASSQRDPSLRKSGAGNVFIKNLVRCRRRPPARRLVPLPAWPAAPPALW